MSAEEVKHCTYIFKMEKQSDDNPETTQSILQHILGPRHEVVSASTLDFPNSTDPNDASVMHHIVKINTPTPDALATRLMGTDWVKKHHIVYTVDFSTQSRGAATTQLKSTQN